MPTDPYAVLRALLRAEAARSAPRPQPEQRPRPERPREQGRR
ncbi:hypothetical protein [Streptomyces galbus]|jgi:hypothetical protein|nr:hypothetical protein [Streptomyces galbus]GHD38256.1 hypothetical protein GCM10010335_36650 [Streptomyces galbus]